MNTVAATSAEGAPMQKIRWLDGLTEMSPFI